MPAMNEIDAPEFGHEWMRQVYSSIKQPRFSAGPTLADWITLYRLGCDVVLKDAKGFVGFKSEQETPDDRS